MSDERDKLIKALEETERKLDEANRKLDEANRKWSEAYHNLWEYDEKARKQ